MTTFFVLVGIAGWLAFGCTTIVYITTLEEIDILNEIIETERMRCRNLRRAAMETFRNTIG